MKEKKKYLFRKDDYIIDIHGYIRRAYPFDCKPLYIVEKVVKDKEYGRLIRVKNGPNYNLSLTGGWIQQRFRKATKAEIQKYKSLIKNPLGD